MKKLALLIISFLVFAYFATAQNRAVFNQGFLSPILVNPSVAGFFEQHQVQFHARAQWTGFPNAPKTAGALYNGPIGNTFGLGVGIFTEKADQLTELRAVLNYSFRFDINENIKLGTGFSTEFLQQTLDNSVRQNDFFDNDDELVNEAIDGRRTLDASVGVYGQFYEKTYAGLAFNNLVGERLDNISSSEQGSFFSHYTFLVGHQFDLTDLNFSLEPSMMIRQVKDAPFMVDFNVKAGFLEDQLIAGLSYRTLGALGVLLGTKLSNFHLYYSFDASLQQIQKYNSGTHEVTIAMHFSRKADRGPYVR